MPYCRNYSSVGDPIGYCGYEYYLLLQQQRLPTRVMVERFERKDLADKHFHCYNCRPFRCKDACFDYFFVSWKRKRTQILHQ